MIDRLKERARQDSGVALVWFATTVTLLLGTAGFAIDLGWLYLHASRAQRTVDAAALTGVTNLPGFPTDADLVARDAARANGYDVCNPGSSGCADTLTTTPLGDSQLLVELDTEVPSLFLKVLGFDSFGITRSATSEYVKPVPLGSPDRCFGRDPSGDGVGCADAGADSFWAAISAPYTLHEQGDPYSTLCHEPSTFSSCSTTNTEHDRGGSYSGYYYAIEIDDSAPVTDLTVQIYDAGFYPSSSGVGDTDDGKWGVGAGNPWAQTTYSLKAVDNTPFDPTDNPSIAGCTDTIDPETDSGTYERKWATGSNSLCQITGTITPGVWVLHVTTSGVGSGSNHYSVRAYTGSGPQPRVYGINDISIWNNTSGNAELYLVEIDPKHAGSKLELEFFDPGDATGDSDMEVWAPNGSGGFVVPNCSWTATNYAGTQVDSATEPCAWETTITGGGQPWYATGDKVFNDIWIRAIVDIPTSYTCNPGSDGCFWKMKLNLSNPTERTTWRARVIGSPVRLVP